MHENVNRAVQFRIDMDVDAGQSQDEATAHNSDDGARPLSALARHPAPPAQLHARNKECSKRDATAKFNHAYKQHHMRPLLVSMDRAHSNPASRGV